MGQNTDSTNDVTSLLPPLMLLLEQMQSQQLNSELESSSTTSPESSVVEDSWNSPSVNHSYPVKGRLTQNSHPGHIGLDFGVVVGTPVHSTIEGKVTYAGWSDAGYGNLVIVENGPYKTYYAHLSEIPVTTGQIIQQGDVIGLSGNTGNSTGPHVHYEVRHKNQRIDPNSFEPNSLYQKA